MPHLFKPITGFLAALTIVSIVPSLAFSQQNSYSDQVVKKAESLMLHEERTWEVLLHYTRTFSGGHESRIDDPRFFLAPDGRTNRGAELEATLRSFFIPPAKDGEHAACRFPARYEWLRTKLDIDASQIPEFRCSERDKSLGAVDADSAVLVFPVGHINSPASMFGHTLIRIDGGTRSNLISYAANYSADTTDTNGFIYAWKGLTGMYKGYYSMMPYYIKVNEYNDLEHRDMWEYKLKLSPVEVGGMLNHIWELQNVHSAYYFLDENCSYNLLFLIEAARPELHLTDKTGIFVLPTQTVQIITASGIVESINYRPSQGAKITKIVSLLDSGEQKLAHGLAFLSIKPESIGTGSLSDIKKMKILDLAASYARFRFARKELGKEVYTKLYLGILKERSRLGTYPADPHEIDTPSTPESGHETSKIGIGTGARRGKHLRSLTSGPNFTTCSIRTEDIFQVRRSSFWIPFCVATYRPATSSSRRCTSWTFSPSPRGTCFSSRFRGRSIQALTASLCETERIISYIV